MPWIIAIAAILVLFQILVEFGVIYRHPHMPTMLLMAGIIFSTLHQSSLGTLYLMVPHKLSHIWYSPWLPLMFFASAVMAGVAMVIVESTLSARFFKRKLEVDLLKDVGQVLCWAIIGYLALRGLDLVLRGVNTEVLVITPQATAFWIEVVIGLLIPLAILLTPEFARSGSWLFVASLAVIAGLIINRFNVAVTGISAKFSEAYFPHWMEIAISIGVVSLGVLVYVWICRHFPVFSNEHEPTATG